MENNSYNKGGLIAFVFSITFCLLFFVYISFIQPGVDLKEIPEVAAPAAQTQAGGEATPVVDVSKIEKPWEENPDMVAHGKNVFKNNCAVCHGNEGKGDGPAGTTLVPTPRNFVEGKWKKGGRSQDLFTTIQMGVGGSSPMVSFKHLPKVDRWGLVQFIRSITKNKVKDDPAQLAAFGPKAE